MAGSAALVWGTWNCHVSQALHSGGLGWLLEAAPRVHVWSLQEVKRVHHLRAALREAGALRDWTIIPGRYARNGAMPYLLVRNRRRFEVERVTRRRLEPAAYPRTMLSAIIHDNRTNRPIWGQSLHVDPLGRGFLRANPRARRRHEQQVQAFADVFGDAPPQAVSVSGGDFNERLRLGPKAMRPDLWERSARGRFEAEGGFPGFRLTRRGSRWVDLDDVFVRDDDYVRVVNRRVLEPPVRGNDHRAVVLRMRVKILK